ncbi:MAG: hypothetical protein ACREYC_24650 [Gammaproteobacteria bacterium]
MGHGICASGMEYHDRPALSMMLGCFPADSFQVFGLIDDRLSDFVSQHSAWYHQHQSRFGVVHGDPRNPKLPQLIRDLAARLGDGFRGTHLIAHGVSPDSRWYERRGVIRGLARVRGPGGDHP